MLPNNDFPTDVLVEAIRKALREGSGFITHIAAMSSDDFDASFERKFIIPTVIRRRGVEVLVGPELARERDAKRVEGKR